MIVTYWGVRGSTPVPGPQTVRFGGNTACLSVQIGERVLVIDAGTGIRQLGDALAGGAQEITLLISHAHADHVIGFPFFAPLYEPGRRIRILDHQANGAAWSLLDLFDGERFPRPRDLCAHAERIGGDVLGFLRVQGFEVRRLPLNHPGGSFGYRITHAGRTLVHLTDHELFPEAPPTSTFAEVVEFCREADVLSADAQYLERELPTCRGRGHSSVDQVCELARASRVKRLVLFHHDPARTDDGLRQIEELAASLLAGTGIRSDAAFEGLRIEL